MGGSRVRLSGILHHRSGHLRPGGGGARKLIGIAGELSDLVLPEIEIALSERIVVGWGSGFFGHD
jgi:hypothetical protein